MSPGKNNYEVSVTFQTFDGYLGFEVEGVDRDGKKVKRFIKLAFEYDGIQHDKYIPQYHRQNIDNYYKQRCRDIAKDAMAAKHDIVVIRLKSFKGFDLNTLNKFQTEIIRQFQEKTGIKLPAMPKYYYDYRTNSIKASQYNQVDIPLSQNTRQMTNNQVRIDNFLGNE